MEIEIELKLERNKLRLKRYKEFNWKRYFLKTFAFLFVLDIMFFILEPWNVSTNELLTLLAMSLWIILLVCSIFTPIITFWYNSRYKTVFAEIRRLKREKKLHSEHLKDDHYQEDIGKK